MEGRVHCAHNRPAQKQARAEKRKNKTFTINNVFISNSLPSNGARAVSVVVAVSLLLERHEGEK